MKRRTAFSALTLGLGLSLGLLAGCGKKTVQPEELLSAYIALLNQEDYADMYDFLTEEAQERISTAASRHRTSGSISRTRAIRKMKRRRLSGFAIP